MMKKSEIEMERARAAKIARALIRLKHSLAADEEINAVLPDTLMEFDKSIQSGELKQLRPTVDDLLGDL
jgi:hypothetical protein